MKGDIGMTDEKAMRLPISLVVGDGTRRELGEVFVRLSSATLLFLSLTEDGFAALEDVARVERVTFVALDGESEIRVSGWIIDYHPIGTYPDRLVYSVEVLDATPTAGVSHRSISAVSRAVERSSR